MRVLISDAIFFDNENNTAELAGDYQKIVEMTTEQFDEWADGTPFDWISEEYNGTILDRNGNKIDNPLHTKE